MLEARGGNEPRARRRRGRGLGAARAPWTPRAFRRATASTGPSCSTSAASTANKGCRRALRLLPALPPRDGLGAAARPHRQGRAADARATRRSSPWASCPTRTSGTPSPPPTCPRHALAAREPVDGDPRGVVGRAAGARQRASARCCGASAGARTRGLYYSSYDEFREALALLEANADLRPALGRNGRRYFDANYTWDVIEGKYLDLLARILPRGAPARRERGARMSARPAGPPAPGRALLRRRHRQRGAGHPAATCARAGFESDIFAEKVHPRMAHLARPLCGVRAGLVRRRRSASSTSRSAAPRGGSSTTPRTAWSRSTTTSRPPTSSSASTRTSPASATTAGASSRRSRPGPSWRLGDSEFNRRELEAAGFARTGVLPIVLDFARLRPSAVARGAAALRRRPHQPALRGPHHPQQEDRRPDPRLRRLPALPRPEEPAAPGRRLSRPRALLRPAAGDGPRPARSTTWSSRATWTTTTSRPTTASPTCSCASPSTRASACPCRRPCTSACRWSPTTPGPCARPCTAGASCSKEKRPERGGGARPPRPARRRAPRRRVLATQARAIARGPRDRLRRAAPRSPAPRFSEADRSAMRIDQWVPALHRGDAIGDSARLMRDAFRALGPRGRRLRPRARRRPRRATAVASPTWRPGGPDDVVILHYALPSPLTAALREHRGRRVLLHHNITPPEFFAGWDDGAGADLRHRPRGAHDPGRATSTWAWPTASSTGRSSRPRASRAPASCPSTSTSGATASRPNPVLRRVLDGRAARTCCSWAGSCPTSATTT